jgi:hypothetical protein
MKTTIITWAAALALCGTALAAGMAPATALDLAAHGLLARHLMAELGNANARRSVRGTKALWIEMSLQKPGESPALDSLAADLRLTDLEGQLRAAGFRLMDPKKRSLALGLRPTLVLSVLYAPKGSEGNDVDFYLVLAKATQDVTPLGGLRMTMTTWLKAGEPIASTGDTAKDVDAIRAAARACVMAFIDTAQDNDTAPAAGAKP